MRVTTPTPPPGPAPEHFPAPWASDWGEDPRVFWQAFTYQGVRQGFRWIPPTPKPFLVGSPDGEYGRGGDEQQHEVILTRGYWLADTACTQALWQAVMGQSPGRFKGEQRPVENVSWDDAQRFVERLNAAVDQVLGRTSDRPGALASAGGIGLESNPKFHLPTEAEWEYACRAGTTGPFSFGDDITPEQANYGGNYPYRETKKGLYRQATVDVASLPPNPWGLYEMHGNVWERCWDWYGDYPAGLVADPIGPATGDGRVLRGGSWIDGARNLRSASRNHFAPGDRAGNVGFRLALAPELRQERQAGKGGAGPDSPRRE